MWVIRLTVRGVSVCQGNTPSWVAMFGDLVETLGLGGGALAPELVGGCCSMFCTQRWCGKAKGDLG